MVSEVVEGREPITIVEIDIDLPDAVTYRFGDPTGALPPGVIPTLQKVKVVPSEINIGGRGKNSVPLGRRAQVSISILDHVEENKPASYWTRWLALHPYFELRPLRVLSGYAGQALEDMETRHYVVDKIDGPGSSGAISITAKDVLAIADNDRAQVPRPTSGVLVENTSADQSGQIAVAGYWGDYASSPVGETVYIRINDEIMGGELGNAGADSFTVTVATNTRGMFGTESSDHEEGDAVQLTEVIEDERPDELIARFLIDYGGVPSEFVDTSEWAAEASVWLESFRVGAVLSESTGVLELVGEITQETGCYIWWDELDQQVRFRAIRPVLPDDEIPLYTDEEHLLAGSISLKRKPEERISMSDVSYLLRNATGDLDKESNFKRRQLDVDLDSATNYRQNRIMKIFSRWLDSNGKVLTLSSRLVSRYSETPIYLQFDMDAKDRALKTGAVIDVQTRYVTDAAGNPRILRWAVISTQEVEQAHRLRYLCQQFEFPLDGNFGTGYMADDAPDYLDASSAAIAAGSWYTDEDGLMSDGSQGVVYV